MTKLPAPLLLLALATPLPAEVTFNEHVAPLIHQNCTGCHRPDQSGPFSLITYRDVKKRSATIEDVLLDRYMPPWKPVNTNIHFANDRRLSQKEIDLFEKWIEAGCPEGDPKNKPKLPDYPSGWYLGEPDLVVTMNGKFEVPAEGRDIYRSFVFPVQLPEDKWVKAVELRPKAKSSVHHALFFIDTDGRARQQDGRDGKAGLKGMTFLPGRDSRGQVSAASIYGLGGHVPGATPARLPGDLAMFLPKRSDVVMQTHFHPSGKKEVEQAELALYFAEKEPEKALVPIQVPPVFGAFENVSIPAGEKNYVVEDQFTVPVPIEAILVGGHAHYLCRDMRMTATLPGGKEMVLMDITDWDLDWQDNYHFKKPIDLPAGTILKTHLRYDNSKDNPENPYDPPRRVQWGQESTDEMGAVTLIVVPKSVSDAGALDLALKGQFVQGVVKRMGLDKNKDGLLQVEEAPPLLIPFFPQLDKDQNQVLDLEEQASLVDFLGTLGRGRGRQR